MDLKGSLINTDIKIFPSQKFIDFIKTLNKNDNLPPNINQFNTTKQNLDVDKQQRGPNHDPSPTVQFNEKDIEHLEKIKDEVKKIKGDLQPEEPENTIENTLNGETEDNCEKNSDDSDTDSVKTENDEVPPERNGPYLTTADMDWLHNYLQKKRTQDKSIPYLHEVFMGSELEMPRNHILKRNPALEARCVKLRSQQEAREYRKMTRGVDNVRMRYPDDSIAYQMKQINRQLIAIGQFIISIFAGFLFGFKGVEWMIGPMDFGFKLLLGVMCALIIALAEIYFLAKKLNEELNVPETVQLGGPPKFVDDKYNYIPKPTATPLDDKEHQD